jgi:chromosomal replication initiation ATPase DnaA
MASLNSLYVKKETLQTLLDVLTKKKENGVELTVSISDESKQFTTSSGRVIEQNVSAWVSQTEDQRKAKKDRFFVGNGKTFWTNAAQSHAEPPKKREEDRGINSDGDGLPF